jgi:hypothetical protein
MNAPNHEGGSARFRHQTEGAMSDVPSDNDAEAKWRRMAVAAVSAAVAGINHAIDRLHEEGGAVALTVHLSGGDKLTVGANAAELIPFLTFQKDVLEILSPDERDPMGMRLDALLEVDAP